MLKENLEAHERWRRKPSSKHKINPKTGKMKEEKLGEEEKSRDAKEMKEKQKQAALAEQAEWIFGRKVYGGQR